MTKSEYITMQTNFRVLSRVAACLFADFPDICDELKSEIWTTSNYFENEYKDALRYVEQSGDFHSAGEIRFSLSGNP